MLMSVRRLQHATHAVLFSLTHDTHTLWHSVSWGVDGDWSGGATAGDVMPILCLGTACAACACLRRQHGRQGRLT